MMKDFYQMIDLVDMVDTVDFRLNTLLNVLRHDFLIDYSHTGVDHRIECVEAC